MCKKYSTKVEANLSIVEIIVIVPIIVIILIKLIISLIAQVSSGAIRIQLLQQ